MIPRGAGQRFVDTPAGRLGVLHAGKPGAGHVPVVLVHGGGTDSSAISWYRLVAPLADDREVWAIDLPGFGASMAVDPVGGPDAMADVLDSALIALGVGRTAVCGVSMGGDVALNLALRHPGRVAGLILIAPGGLVSRFRSPAAQRAAWLAARLPDALLLPAGRLANRFVRSALRHVVNDPSVLPPEAVDEFSRLARDPRGVLGYARYNQACIGRDRMLNDLTDRVHAITAPTLFFHGADDPLVDPQGSTRAVARMPQARLVLVPDCGHWAQLERHDEFLEAALPFLAALDDRRR